MCRLFGFRGTSAASVDHLLIDSPSSLSVLSREHPHGWGIGSYRGEPILQKGSSPAHADPQFERVARETVSDCVLAHVRRRSVGDFGIENNHPFVHGRLMFAHNGTVQGFDGLRAQLEAAIKPKLARLIHGTTDSERCFLLFLGHLDDMGALESPRMDDIALALARTVCQVRALPAPPNQPHMLTFLVTDGSSLVGVRAGEKELWVSKRPAAGTGDRLERAYIASQPLSSDDAWVLVGDETLIGIDGSMRLRQWPLAELAARMVA